MMPPTVLYRDIAAIRAFLLSRVHMPGIVRSLFPCLRRIAVVMLLAGIALPALAQQEAAPAPAADGGGTISSAQIEKLISTLENESERQAFIENLKALVEGQKAVEGEREGGTDLVGIIAARLARLDEQVEVLAGELDDGSAMLDWIGEQIADSEHRAVWVETGLQIALILGVALLAWLALKAVVARHLRQLESRSHGGWAERLRWRWAGRCFWRCRSRPSRPPPTWR
jgi:hypothetical protein